LCPNDPNKVFPGTCGCGVSDMDTDSDGTLDCNDQCPNDPNKVAPGNCGCGVVEYSGCITSISSTVSNVSIDVFPNPYTKETTVYVNSLSSSSYELQIVDSKETVVYINEHSTNTSISVGENLSSGMYFGRIIMNDEVLTFKIVKQ
jgi:hypothetical protein